MVSLTLMRGLPERNSTSHSGMNSVSPPACRDQGQEWELSCFVNVLGLCMSKRLETIVWLVPSPLFAVADSLSVGYLVTRAHTGSKTEVTI